MLTAPSPHTHLPYTPLHQQESAQNLELWLMLLLLLHGADSASHQLVKQVNPLSHPRLHEELTHSLCEKSRYSNHNWPLHHLPPLCIIILVKTANQHDKIRAMPHTSPSPRGGRRSLYYTILNPFPPPVPIFNAHPSGKGNTYRTLFVVLGTSRTCPS